MRGSSIYIHLTRHFPIVDWLLNYKRGHFKGDLSAGLTVGIMLIPQGMAYAMLAGLEPIHGLYAAVASIIAYSIFGTSRQLAVGPVAMDSLLTATAIYLLQPTSVGEYLSYAITLAFMIGVIQFILGSLKLGGITNFISNPVISGFTSAAAIIIGLSQIKHLTRINLPQTEYVIDILKVLTKEITSIHLPSLLLGIGGIVIITYSKKIHRYFPAQLAAVVVGMLVVYAFQLTNYDVKIMGEVPNGLPPFSIPLFDIDKWKLLLPAAFTIALVGFAESYAVAKTIQNKHKDYELNPNQELKGIGAANIGAAFFQGFPVTGGFSRTAINDHAGAKTGLAALISAGLLILTLLFFTKVFYYLPDSILAAVVLTAVTGLVDYKSPKYLWKNDKIDFWMLILTFVVTLTFGIVNGIVAGVTISLAMVIYKASRPHMARLGRVPDTNVYRNIDRFSNLEEPKELLIVRIDGPVYFANTEFIKKGINKWIEEKTTDLQCVIINMESVTHIDSTGAQAMCDWINTWLNNGLEVFITDSKGPIRDTLKQWGIIDKLGCERVFMTVAQAVDQYQIGLDDRTKSKISTYALQSGK